MTEVKATFLDRPNVRRQLERLENWRALEDYARYLRTVARRSIRKTTAKPGSKAWRRPSRPGKPPRSRAPGHPLREFIFFKWDPVTKSVVVGPEFLPGRHTSGPPVPGIHEKGKTVVRVINTYPQKMRKASSQAQAKAYQAALRAGRVPYPQPIKTATITAKYPSREYMWPATQKTVRRFPDMYKKGVSRG